MFTRMVCDVGRKPALVVNSVNAQGRDFGEVRMSQEGPCFVTEVNNILSIEVVIR